MRRVKSTAPRPGAAEDRPDRTADDEPFLGYSTNVHRGEDLRQVYGFLSEYSVPVRQRVFGSRPAGLELRIGTRAVRQLESPSRRREFAEFLDRSGLQIFSFNAFPLRDFQAQRVKTRVYAPDWTERPRIDWTVRIAELLADLLPADRPGSVSTLAGTYRPRRDSAALRDRIARGYLEAVAALEEIAARTGRDIVLAVEPEPDTTLETSAEVVRFLEDHLLPGAWALWKGRYRSRQRVEEVVRRRFTVNADTCHFSVLFEDPARAVRDLVAAGIRIGKVHVTNALALRNPYRSPRGYEVFRGMDEPRFMHQFCGVDGRGRTVWRGRDLDELPARLDAARHPAVVELRTHFHVPLYLRRWKNLQTTQDGTRAAIAEVLRQNCCSQLVIETYTWPVLAEESALVNGIAREFRWLLRELAKTGRRRPAPL